MLFCILQIKKKTRMPKIKVDKTVDTFLEKAVECFVKLASEEHSNLTQHLLPAKVTTEVLGSRGPVLG